MAKHQKPFGGAPRLGGDAPGEPLPSPSRDGVQVKGKNTLTTIHRGEKQVGGPNGETFPSAYGGAPSFVSRPTPKRGSGSGDGSGNGSIDGRSSADNTP